MDVTIPPGETTTIWLPGATAIRIDARYRVIAVDGTSSDTPLGAEWLVQDLRDGTYGDFHQLRPAVECFDTTCAQGGQHGTAEERAGRVPSSPEDRERHP
jgi:hypothetical protein